jgi:hypothetical protein
MNITDEITASRGPIGVRCGFLPATNDFLSVAAHFTLFSDPSIYRTVSKLEAQAILTRLLHRDLVFNSIVVPEEQALRLSNSFLSKFPDAHSTFYTNIDFSREGEFAGATSAVCGPEWNSATESTFDAGLIVLGPEQAGCIWIEDED